MGVYIGVVLMVVGALTIGTAIGAAIAWLIYRLDKWHQARRARKADQQTPLGEIQASVNYNYWTQTRFGDIPMVKPFEGFKLEKQTERQPMTEQEFIDSFKKGSK